jgi:ankyrin repeat protein
MLDRLLESPTDIIDIEADGYTAIHYLARYLVQIEATRYLISRGADISVVNHKGNTPLYELIRGTIRRRLGENRIPDPA